MASMSRMPSRCSARSSSTSKAVISTAQGKGMWNKRFSAIALPSTSARSQAAMAISQAIQLGQRLHAGQ